MGNITRNKQFRQGIFILVDIVIVIFCIWFGLAMRFSITGIPEVCRILALRALPFDVAITIIVFWIFRLYHSIWTYASLHELIRVFEAVFVVAGVEIVFKTMLLWTLPRGCYVITYMTLLILVAASRMSARVLRRYSQMLNTRENRNRIMIVGAGSAGSLLLTELARQKDIYGKVICMVDDNPVKHGKYMNGVKVEGDRSQIPRLAKRHRISEIIIAMPSAKKEIISETVELCNETDCRVRILPLVVRTLDGNLAANIRDISYEDLLGRDQIRIKDTQVEEYLKGKVIMVTGGGGSIGSELCRQIAGFSPKHLVLVDIYENNAYDLQMELRRDMPDLNLTVLIASVRDLNRMDGIIGRYKPQVIFHAAAHKHVPLMEASPWEAIKNNCMGTRNMARLADKYEVEKFVLISTDKAVNPTNVMGATKRICEMIIQDWAKKSELTAYAAVRFGNVLGSNGSVIPLFLRQIENGGPVTVTHKEITRFFMTIPEAVTLVLQAGAYAKGGEIFVLDMGKQVRIYDLAEKLIRMKGFRPNEDIQIEVTGLRPGEKLYEEVLMDEEGLQNTENDLIHVGKPIEMDYEKFETELEELIQAAYSGARDIKERVRDVCTTYTITDNE